MIRRITITATDMRARAHRCREIAFECRVIDLPQIADMLDAQAKINLRLAERAEAIAAAEQRGVAVPV